MTKLSDTPNTPGTKGYDDRKPASVSGTKPAEPLPAARGPARATNYPGNDSDGQHRTGSEDSNGGEAGVTVTGDSTARRQGGVAVNPVTEPSLATDPAATPQTQPWATAHGDEKNRRLVITVDCQNYNGVVADPGDRAAYAKMLRDMADKVEIGLA